MSSQSNDRMTRVGLVGCGRVTEDRHLPLLHRLPDVQVVALADLNPERVDALADQFHVSQRYTDYRNLLAQPDIHIVGVVVPAQFHSEIVLASLNAGKHVFVEKPLALSLDDCDLLLERAATSPGKVMVGHNLRWHRLVRQARDMVLEGILGPIRVVRTSVSSQFHEREPKWSKHRHLGGGLLLEVAIHDFDLWRFLTGSEVTQVFAFSRSEQREDETAVVTAMLASGALATAVLSKGTGENHEIELYGEKGQLRASLYRFDGLEFTPATEFPGSIPTRIRRGAQGLQSLIRAAAVIRQGGDYVGSYRAEWCHFLDSIRRNTSCAPTLEDGRRALKIALAAAASADRGEPVLISQAPRTITPIRGESRVVEKIV